MSIPNTRVSGHVRLQKRARGDIWYAKYRLPDGRQVQKKLGPAWTERGRPPAGYYTAKTADQELQAILADARRGTLAETTRPIDRTFEDACAEWLRYVEHDKDAAVTTMRDYRNTVKRYLVPYFGANKPVSKITTDDVEAFRSTLLTDFGVSRRTAQKVLVGFTAHDLRHTFGTMAVQVWSTTDVKAYMGHANVSTTEIYAHHVPKRNAAAELSAFVAAQRPASVDTFDGRLGAEFGTRPGHDRR